MSIPSLRQQMINEALDYHMNMNHVVFNRERKNVEVSGQEEMDKKQSDIIIEGQIRDRISAILSSIQRIIQSFEYKKSTQPPRFGGETEVAPGVSGVSGYPGGKNPELGVQRRIADSLSDIVSQFNSTADFINLTNRQKVFTQKDISGIDGLMRQLIDPMKTVLGSAAGDVRSREDVEDLQTYTRVYNVIKDMIDKITVGMPYQKVDVSLLTSKVPINEELLQSESFDPYGAHNSRYLATLTNQISSERERISKLPKNTPLEQDAHRLLSQELDKQEDRVRSSGYKVVSDEGIVNGILSVSQFYEDVYMAYEEAKNNLVETMNIITEPIEYNHREDIASYKAEVAQRFDMFYGAIVYFFRTFEEIRDSFPKRIREVQPLMRPYYQSIADNLGYLGVDTVREMKSILKKVPYIKDVVEGQQASINDIINSPQFDVKQLLPKALYWEGNLSKDEKAISGSDPLRELEYAYIHDDIDGLAQEIIRRRNITMKQPVRVRNPSGRAAMYEDFTRSSEGESKAGESGTETEAFPSIYEEESERGVPIIPSRFPIRPPRQRQIRQGIVAPPPAPPGRPRVPQGRVRPSDIPSFPQTLQGQVARTSQLARQPPITPRQQIRAEAEDVIQAMIREIEEQSGQGKPKRKSSKKGGHIHKRHDFQDDDELKPYLTTHLRPSKYRKNVPPIESSSGESSGEEGEGSDMEIDEMRLGKGKKKMTKKEMKALANMKALSKLPKADLGAVITKHKKGGAKYIKPVAPVIKDSGADKDLWFL